MPFCTWCGKESATLVRFCPACGKDNAPPQSSIATLPSPPPPPGYNQQARRPAPPPPVDQQPALAHRPPPPPPAVQYQQQPVYQQQPNYQQSTTVVYTPQPQHQQAVAMPPAYSSQPQQKAYQPAPVNYTLPPQPQPQPQTRVVVVPAPVTPVSTVCTVARQFCVSPQLLSFGDYVIKDQETGRTELAVEGKKKSHSCLFYMNGKQIGRLIKLASNFSDSWEFIYPGGNAVIDKKILTFTDSYKVKTSAMGDLTVGGDWAGYAWKITQGIFSKEVARAYRNEAVTIQKDMDTVLILGVVVALDMVHKDHNK